MEIIVRIDSESSQAVYFHILPNFAEKASPVSVSARGGDESVFF